MSPEERLDQVVDRDSFIAFVQALAAEREEAEQIERADPIAYRVDGAMNWKNARIAAFLDAALQYFEPKPYHTPESEPSWLMFAEFLYCGKIIE